MRSIIAPEEKTASINISEQAYAALQKMARSVKQFQSQHAAFLSNSISSRTGTGTEDEIYNTATATAIALSLSASSSYDDDDDEDFTLDFNLARSDHRSESPIQIPSTRRLKKPEIFVGDASELVLTLNNALKSAMCDSSKSLLRLREENSKSLNTLSEQHSHIATQLEIRIQELNSESKLLKVLVLYMYSTWLIFSAPVFVIHVSWSLCYRRRKRTSYRRYELSKRRCHSLKSRARKSWTS